MEKQTTAAAESSDSDARRNDEHRSHPSFLTVDEVNTTLDTESASFSPPPSSASPATETSSPSPQASKPASRQAQVAIKILVTNNASGSIIGRGGKTITDLQDRSQTRIKLSQGGDYYPGTGDRVCLINGALSNVELAVEMVLEKLYHIQRSQHVDAPATRSGAVYSQPGSNISASAPFNVRILLPASSCGMIIGHGGSNIKLLKEKSLVSYIQLSPKTAEVVVLGGSTLSTSERIMTILGPTFESCVTCIQCILNELAQHPEICRYLNMTTSYSKVVLSAFQSSYNAYQIPTLMNQPAIYQSSTGFMSDQYGILGEGQAMGFQPYSDSIMSTSPPTRGQAMMIPTSPPPSSPLMFMTGTSGSSGMLSMAELAGSFQERVALADPPQHLPHSPVVETSIEVPDSMIGLILGHGGKSLNRIQTSTQTRISLSRRGDFVPGTNNRLVTITGSSYDSVEYARNLINKRLPSSYHDRYSSPSS